MNTDTGRIYPPEELRERFVAMEKQEALDDHQAEFERAYHANKIVPVSEDVAHTVRTGQRVKERRAKRKAAKAARKRNRAR